MVEPDLRSQWSLCAGQRGRSRAGGGMSQHGDLVWGDRRLRWPARPLTSREFSRTGEGGEWVWVSSPSEMPHRRCLGCSAFWEAGTQGAEAGIVSRDLNLDQDQWFGKWPQRCWLEGASYPKGLWWKWCPPLARVLGLSSWGAEDQEVVFEVAWRDVVISGENLVTCLLTFWSK